MGPDWKQSGLGEATRTATFQDAYTYDLASELLLWLAEHGRGLGLANDVQNLLESTDLKFPRNGKLARVLFERARR